MFVLTKYHPKVNVRNDTPPEMKKNISRPYLICANDLRQLIWGGMAVFLQILNCPLK
jgi:hypothetical protein